MRFFRRNRLTINDVKIALDGWHNTQRTKQVLQYNSPIGDLFSLNFFDLEPDIAAPLSDVRAVRDFYRQMFIQSNTAMIECDVVDLAGLAAVYVLAKMPLEHGGFVYVGSYTLPRRDQSYVLKYQAAELEVTGIREAAVIDLLQLLPDDETDEIPGWSSDPYDDTLNYPVMRNMADDAEFDDRFPDHPLSRTRRFLADLENRVTISDRLRSAPEFNG